MTNFLGAMSFLLAIIASLCLAERIPPRVDHSVHTRREVCPGALYFYSGKRPIWAKHMRVVCKIDGHTFLTDHK